MNLYFELRVLAYLFFLMSMALVVSAELGSGDDPDRGSGVSPVEEEWSGAEDFKMEEVLRNLCMKSQWSMERARSHFDEDSKAQCPRGFVYLPGTRSCYRFIFERLDWKSADDRCRKVNPDSRLVAVDTATEDVALSSYINARIETDPRVFDCVDREPSGQHSLNWWTASLLRSDAVRGLKSLVWQRYPGIARPASHPRRSLVVPPPGPPPCPPGDKICFCNFELFLRQSKLQTDKAYCFVCEYERLNNQHDKESSKTYQRYVLSSA